MIRWTGQSLQFLLHIINLSTLLYSTLLPSHLLLPSILDITSSRMSNALLPPSLLAAHLKLHPSRPPYLQQARAL